MIKIEKGILQGYKQGFSVYSSKFLERVNLQDFVNFVKARPGKGKVSMLSAGPRTTEVLNSYGIVLPEVFTYSLGTVTNEKFLDDYKDVEVFLHQFAVKGNIIDFRISLTLFPIRT